jgi:hypothetical protein
MKKTVTLFVLVFCFFIFHFFLVQKGILKPGFIYAATQNESSQSADVRIDLSEYLTLGTGQRLSGRFDTPASMVNLLVRVIFVGVGLILLAMIVVSGLSMIAGGKSENMEKAKSTMTSAVIGFLVIFAAYWILQIIQIFTGANIGF